MPNGHRADTACVVRLRPPMLRSALLCAVAALAAAPAASSGTSKGSATWARPQIALVVKAGLMAPSVSEFRPLDPLDQASLQSIVERLGVLFATGAAPVAATTVPTTTTATTTTTAVPLPLPWTASRWKATSPTASVTVAQFDRVLVGALGLTTAATTIRVALRDAGLAPPARVGTETVARLLGLRFNHPAADDALEPLPDQPISRAEAAYSVARALTFDVDDHDSIEQSADEFATPLLATAWQQEVLRTAVSYVGFPYVWGGTSPTQQSPFGMQAQGGFDCSGLVWQVFKLTAYADAPALAAIIKGRTTYEMAAEGGKAARIAKVESLDPGDVLFFGRGPASKPAEISHTGIYLGNGWMVHSSGNGTTITPFSGWYRSSFAWARRPLREAGLGT
jgi:cell wall-associated NlpC family hydrolase